MHPNGSSSTAGDLIRQMCDKIERGEIRGAEKPGHDQGPQEEGKAKPRAGGYNRYPVAEPWWDDRRGYVAGEKTTCEKVEVVLGVMLENGRPMKQTDIIARCMEATGRPKHVVTTWVSGSLLWLRVVGLIKPGRKVGRTWIWITQATVDDAVARGRAA